MEKTIKVELSEKEYLTVLKALITQSNVNGIFDLELAELISKLSALTIEQ